MNIKTNNPTYLPGHEPPVYKKIFEFTVLWEGWELDTQGWVVEDENGNREILLTNHGSEYIAEAHEIQEFIEGYQHVIADMRKALSLLKEKALQT